MIAQTASRKSSPNPSAQECLKILHGLQENRFACCCAASTGCPEQTAHVMTHIAALELWSVHQSQCCRGQMKLHLLLILVLLVLQGTWRGMQYQNWAYLHLLCAMCPELCLRVQMMLSLLVVVVSAKIDDVQDGLLHSGWVMSHRLQAAMGCWTAW